MSVSNCFTSSWASADAVLTEWRLALAADLLRRPDAIVGSVAERVGYGSLFALGTALERVRALSRRE